MPNLFTYGTLKQGQSRGGFLRDQKFLGRFHTKPSFRLYQTGSYPCLVSAKDGYAVFGEVYEVNNDKIWNMLDKIEGVEFGLYKRIDIEVINSKGESVDAIAYEYLQPTARLKEVGRCWPVEDYKFWDVEGKVVVKKDDGLQILHSEEKFEISPVLPNLSELSKWCENNALIFGNTEVSAEHWEKLLKPFLEKVEQMKDGVFTTS